MSRQVDALRTGLVVIRAITLSLSVGFAHVLTLLGLAIPTDYSAPALVPRGCGFADPIAYGIDDSGTEGKMAIGA